MAAAGGRAWLVGGGVRDAALGRAWRDVDLEVFHLPPEKLVSALGEAFELDLVGRAYGIYKLKGTPIDVGLPRRESKKGRGHRGFAVQAEPDLGLAEAAARRDFTINAIYFDPLRQEVRDPCGGLRDLRDRCLRHTSAAFAEDPLRVLRGMQFVARFHLEAAPETLAICRRMEREGLAPERLFEEWDKLILRGHQISLGLKFLRETGWDRYFPELQALQGVPQDPRHHPEGDVWVHTLHSMDAFARQRLGQDTEDRVVGFAVLCHDFGKPASTRQMPDRIRALGHEAAGEEPTRAFLGRMTSNRQLMRDVAVLVREHLKPAMLYRDRSRDAAILRLAARVGRIDRLVRVARADSSGRPPLPADSFPAGAWLLAQACRLGVCDTAPQPLVQGRDLLAWGLEAGEEFRDILGRCFEAQLDGEIQDLEQARQLVEREFGPELG
ncbi:polynucleotide adenylyltransferase [bacterium DOLJORAL78_65_58]|nr:MAG: polynucleotide adenylyltransferase [bacterium DOLZORAL124_64_63]PIE76267.1 MAG: polynucleotide adenylyltransferase [bacterium DOLJORAL78_65_58]